MILNGGVFPAPILYLLYNRGLIYEVKLTVVTEVEETRKMNNETGEDHQ